jgi:signal transduction histidine kinase/HPt (histidine-containing phosphotransfer) domain-containing protein
VKFETKYEKLVVLSSVFLLLLVCGMGLWVYIRLSNVADNIMENKPKDTRLLILKELNTDLITAENYVFAFAFRDDDTILSSFYQISNHTKFKIGQLRRLPSNDKFYKRNIDTLEQIVKQRFETLEGIILVRNENRVDEAMEQVVSEVKTMTAANKRVPKPAPQQLTERRKLFQRRKKQQGEAVAPTVIPLAFNAKAINQELGEIRKDVVYQEQRRNALKLGLEQKNNRLLARFTRLAQTIENQEKKAILKEANEAQRAAQETQIVIALFCVASVLLIGFVAYLMYNLIGKTRATNRQLQIAKDKSDQLTASKSRFLANMSHEIRTPLNAIVGFAEQLNDTELKEDQQRKVSIIQKSAEHLNQITSDILDVSKINSGAIQLEAIPVPIREEVLFVEQSMQDLASANDNKLKVQLDADLPEFIIGDALRLRQILINLLSNAMKFTHNGIVRLSVKPAQQSSKDLKLVIVVSDTGIGISAENIKRVFDEFEQAETSTTRDYGGTGLGLTITQNLVRLMGGEILVKSDPGKGTTFKVTIPVQIATEAAAGTIPEEITDFPALKGKRILIVDDELYNRKLLRNMLGKWDTSITEVEDGEEALREVEQSDYDLILLDLRMPKLDGFQTRKAIQQLGETKANIPIVALTAALTSEERLHMLEDQWKAVLLKPLKMKDLLSCLRPMFPEQAGPTAAPDPEPAEAPDSPISLEPLREISGNDSKFYLDMLRTFHRTTRDGLLAINQTSQKKDWEGMAEAAHKIASPVKHVQAIEAYELLKQLERAGRTNSIESSIHQQILRLNESIENVLRMIDLEIGKVE